MNLSFAFASLQDAIDFFGDEDKLVEFVNNSISADYLAMPDNAQFRLAPTDADKYPQLTYNEEFPDDDR